MCKPSNKADVGRQANPKGKTDVERTTAVRLACVAVLQGALRALHCILTLIFRTPALV